MSPLALAIICIVLFVGMCTLCTGVIVAIIRVRRKRQKIIFAPHWSIPGMFLFVLSFETRTVLFSGDIVQAKTGELYAFSYELIPLVNLVSLALFTWICYDFLVLHNPFDCEEWF